MTTDLDTIFFELVALEGIPTASTVESFTKRFPEFATEIAEFAIELATDPTRWEGNPTPPAIDPAQSDFVKRAVSRYLNARSTPGKTAEYENPFSKLTTKAAFRELATQLDANTAFMTRVQSRLIDPEDIPPVFTRRLSKALAVPDAAVLGYLTQPPTVPAHASYKSKTKPEVQQQQSFKEAAVASGLTDSEIERLKTKI